MTYSVFGGTLNLAQSINKDNSSMWQTDRRTDRIIAVSLCRDLQRVCYADGVTLDSFNVNEWTQQQHGLIKIKQQEN